MCCSDVNWGQAPSCVRMVRMLQQGHAMLTTRIDASTCTIVGQELGRIENRDNFALLHDARIQTS